MKSLYLLDGLLACATLLLPISTTRSLAALGLSQEVNRQPAVLGPPVFEEIAEESNSEWMAVSKEDVQGCEEERDRLHVKLQKEVTIEPIQKEN